MTRFPDFLIIGAAKCGTTSLASYLASHEKIFMARPKEVRFFSHHWNRGVDWYAERFEAAPAEGLTGEASVQYTQAPVIQDVPARMAEVVPDAQLIYLVRNPIDQMASLYRHRVDKGPERARTFDRALVEDPIYLTIASYGFQVSRYLEYFPQSQLLILDSADLLKRRAETLEVILTFLGVDGRVPEERLDPELNRGSDKGYLPTCLSYPRALWRAGKRVTGRLPRRWRHSVRRALSKPLPAEAFYVSPTTRLWLRAKLETDLRTLMSVANGRLDEAVPSWITSLRSDAPNAR